MYLGTNESRSIFVGQAEIKPKNEVELLGLKIDQKLTFSSHIKQLCMKANNKVSELLRIRKYMNITQARTLVNSFILPFFLILSFSLDVLSKKRYIDCINKVHKRALRTVQKNFSLTFEELLSAENTVCFHRRHLQMLMLEVYKSVVQSNPLLIMELFSFKNCIYNLRRKNLLEIPPAKDKNIWYKLTLFQSMHHLELASK